MMKLRILVKLLVCCLAVPVALADVEFLDAAVAKYPNIEGTSLESCMLCHVSPVGGDRNPYGLDYKKFGQSFTAIEFEDSDNDGADNIVEINALTMPGNPNSVPASITVKKPNGGETWTIGTKALVTWSSAGNVGPDVTIELWQNGQKMKTLKGTTPNDGKQRVPLKDTLPTGTGFTVKVKSATNASIADVSNASFTINPAAP
ncbi:MAG: hypothetical protein FJY92_02025 [Candidatus Hydrogenedentes bacterium]|nr:hypothetical protein [Candidatus Hydrogenedentota bacterium]